MRFLNPIIVSVISVLSHTDYNYILCPLLDTTPFLIELLFGSQSREEENSTIIHNDLNFAISRVNKA